MASSKSTLDLKDATQNMLSVIYYYILKLIIKLESKEWFQEKSYCSSLFINSLRISVSVFSEYKIKPMRPVIKYQCALDIVMNNFLALDNMLNKSITKKTDLFETQELLKTVFNQNKQILSYFLHEKDFCFPKEPYIMNEESAENILPYLLYYLRFIDYQFDYLTKAPKKLKETISTLNEFLSEETDFAPEDPNKEVKGLPIDALQQIDSITNKLDKYINFRYMDIYTFKENAVYKAKLKKDAQEAISSVMTGLSETC